MPMLIYTIYMQTIILIIVVNSRNNDNSEIQTEIMSMVFIPFYFLAFFDKAKYGVVWTF